VISGEDHTIVTARRGPLGIELEFLDSRAPFDPTVKPARPRAGALESADVRGRGLSLIHSYADKLTYSNDGTYNRIGLTIKSA
jgi:serine/threonine-protein kinase RsbW